ncbi:hypothetical protein N7536_010481 [Penicillium majusculum]|nr:hypothetical protein N7536_010481 [Penicillium majusculum]
MFYTVSIYGITLYGVYGVYGDTVQNMKIEHSIVSSGTKNPLSRGDEEPCPIKVRRRSTQRLARHSDQRVDRHVLLQRAKRLGAKEPIPASCHIRILTNVIVVYAPYSLQSTDVTLLRLLYRVESQVAAEGPT